MTSPMQTARSVHNPFRATPTSTGTSFPSTTRRSPPPEPATNPNTRPVISNDESSSSASAARRNADLIANDTQSTSAAGPSTAEDASDPLSEELPPAYTPAADFIHGETSVEFGPRRPFQQSSRPYLPNGIMSQQTGSWQSPMVTGSSWSGYPGDAQRQTIGSSGLRSNIVPPPRHPSVRGDALWQGLSLPNSQPHTRPQFSDFARDFYATGADADPGILGGPSSQYTGPSPTSRSTPPPDQYSPPPGQPPPRSSRNHQDTPNDGTPTKTPVPGHPLLRDGKVLVYPVGFECRKCRNTGYKNYDPSHPCSKCWQKYAKSYTGPLAYTPWASSQSLPSSGNGAHTNLQRPLPSFAPPQQSFRTSGSLHRTAQSHSGFGDSLSPPTSGLSRSASSSRAHSGYPGAAASQSRVIPISGGGVPMSPYLDPLQRPPYPDPSSSPPRMGSNMALQRPSYNTTSGSPVTIGHTSAPPPGAPVVRPGDPRIGGRLCWRCGGSGVISFLIFDERTCGVCDGIGRTFD